MDFAMLPPEVNSGRMYAGPGSGPMMAAATAWNGLAAELQSTSASYESVISELSGGSWLGPSSASMAAAAAPYVDWMTAAAGQAEQTATQAKAAAAAYEAAFAMTVPPAVITANRTLLMTLIATNIFGQNTAAIAATETDYAEMWAQDTAAMYGYAGSSAAASTLTPFTSPPPTTNPAGAGSQAAAVTQSSTSSGSQLMSALPQALQSLASSTTAAAPAQSLSDLLTPISVALTLLEIPIGTTSIGSSATSISAAFTGVGTNFRGFLINADRDFASGKGPYTGYGPGAANLPEWFFHGQGSVAAPSDATTASVSAGLGQANTVGRLSVPSAWTVAAPEIRPAAFTLPISGAVVAPEIAAGSSGNLFSNMGLAGAAGGAVGSSASVGRGDQRTRVTARGNPTPPQRPQGEPVAEIAAELREIAARAQSLLTKLAESGLMTTDEVTEQKQRFRW
ncbi:PPE family protein [Mycobacterium sp.]|jgi:PPE-repeat protein|uniref:PPE family protein n=1 Tax=Mycobacterium sp. TaxID=1785 RepID=UPI002B6F4F80|nr:PPE family protein [Mycobacterium sp.]HXB87821.1 PPE family protein [Mycobacterium sp.]